VFLCYGRMSNRDALKRYGFCLSQNKYNNMCIKLRLEQNDPEFKYRRYIIQKFFSVDRSDGKVKTEEDNDEDSSMDIQSRHFRIYYQKLNTSKLKFILFLMFVSFLQRSLNSLKFLLSTCMRMTWPALLNQDR
jgi:hypothetical protein